MDSLQHDRFLEALEELTPLLRVAPEIPHRFRASVVSGLVVAETQVIDRLQLAKVADKDHGYVAEMVFLWIESSFCKKSAFRLL